ncbi:sugar phosphate isomerase/epimerase [Paenibacillus sp. BC26]|uniref:sugar phosphate isomerase/epimerase family protein n=1 Tax=Paenibacillus sp. BC26 TaxID=1881032 RepID=UPI0008E533BC|nr:sugar phosphate isomerase/epimerase [Paenibacillus sp. BC26]SFS74274.1 Sugar phosphate isomerase/epimerase [Paenibacillus sp. BC26]
MSNSNIQLSVFTKPWKTQSVAEIAENISGLGFDGIEFPLRDGYQVEPKDADRGLPKLVSELAKYNLSVFSVASTPDERVFAACAEASVPMIRIMTSITFEEGYMASERRERQYLESLLPLCQKYNVQIGVQQHYGSSVIDAMGLLHLLEGIDSRYIKAIWDSAHDGLTGLAPEHGLDIVWSQLGMVNLKNAYYQRVNGPEAEQAKFERHFTLGRHGMSPWPRVIAYLQKRNYNGVITMTAEYTDEHKVDEYIAIDVAQVRSLLGREG